jgi:hypothetical protein
MLGQPSPPILGSGAPAKDGSHTGEPLPIPLPCSWRVDLRDQLLGPRLGGGLNINGQMYAARLGVLSALFPQRTRGAVRCIGVISAVDGVADLVPTGFQINIGISLSFEDYSP